MVNRVAQTVYCLPTGWTTGPSKFYPRQKQKIFPLTSVFRLALGHTQPPVQCLLGVLSPGLKRGRDVTFTTHLHLVSRMSRSYSCSPSSAFMACSGTALTLEVINMYMRPTVLVPCFSSGRAANSSRLKLASATSHLQDSRYVHCHTHSFEDPLTVDCACPACSGIFAPMPVSLYRWRTLFWQTIFWRLHHDAVTAVYNAEKMSLWRIGSGFFLSLVFNREFELYYVDICKKQL
jgi:hypothetical protein